MSGIAELLVNLGYEVSGSDAKPSGVTDRLSTLGVRVFEGHAASQLGDADVLVVSSAIRPANPEIVEARRRRIPVIPRAEMLAELMRLKYGVAVAGAHGKTTTTSMIALVLERAGLDPTAVIGGRLGAFGSNARLGGGDCIVAEADESDRSFLKLWPVIAVITNIDREHLENYGGSLASLLDAFVDFANRVPFYGAVVACADDPFVQELLPRMTRRVTTYGLNRRADLHADAVVFEGYGARCQVIARAPDGTLQELGELTLRVPGRHNVSNALAAIAVAIELGVPFDRIAPALAGFIGADRRFQRLGDVGDITVVDDYGHHPTEIAAVVAAGRLASAGRVVLVFQPHRYTRTADLIADFGRALGAADEIVLTDIYAAGEDPIAGVTIETVVDAVRRASAVPVHLVKQLDDVAEATARLAQPGDLIITLGAGSIGTIGPRILEALGVRGGSASVAAGDR